jgi:hypothetical protein
MDVDVLLIIAALLAVVATLVVVFMCRSFSAGEAFCPARFWSRRPAWEHDQASGPKGQR